MKTMPKRPKAATSSERAARIAMSTLEAPAIAWSIVMVLSRRPADLLRSLKGSLP